MARRERLAGETSIPRAPGILLGIGLGGFVDGIVLHQILQWHHLLSSTSRYPATDLGGLEDNTLADGLFHAATWVACAIGVVLLWQRARNGATGATAGLLGWMLSGWGLFNLIEGLVDHHLLQLHHVREGVGNRELYDAGFLIFGVALVAIGLALSRRPGAHPRGRQG